MMLQSTRLLMTDKNKVNTVAHAGHWLGTDTSTERDV